MCTLVAAAGTAALVPGASGGAAAAAGGDRFLACLVVGRPGPSSGPFGPAAQAGLSAAEKLGVQGRVVHAGSPAAYADGLRSCARRGAGITIGAGFPMAGSVDAVATALPRSTFAVLDVEAASLAHRPKNVIGVQFAQEEAGYLVGFAAGLWAKRADASAVGSIGGLDIPPVERYLAGFEFGAERADPGVKTLHAFADDLDGPATCRRKALDQIEHGSVVEFEVAGACGRGAIAAAHAKGVFAIGVGTGIVQLGPWVMTSALERVDVAVLSVIRAAKDGTLQTGADMTFDARRQGIDYDTWSARVPVAIRAAVARQYARLAAGKITGIPLTVK